MHSGNKQNKQNKSQMSWIENYVMTNEVLPNEPIYKKVVI